jgi:hypothetical protein
VRKQHLSDLLSIRLASAVQRNLNETSILCGEEKDCTMTETYFRVALSAIIVQENDIVSKLVQQV